MYSSFLADCATVIRHMENHGLLGYLAVVAVMLAGVPFLIIRQACIAISNALNRLHAEVRSSDRMRQVRR